MAALLSHLDRFQALNEQQTQEAGEFRGIITVATTQNLHNLHPAILGLGRLELHVAVPLPNEGQRQQIWTAYFARLPFDVDNSVDVLVQRLAENSAGELLVEQRLSRDCFSQPMFETNAFLPPSSLCVTNISTLTRLVGCGNRQCMS